MNQSEKEKCHCDFIHMWNLRNRTDEHRERKKEERAANHKKLLTTENKLRVDGGRLAGDGLNGQWVLRRALHCDESLNSTPENNITLLC